MKQKTDFMCRITLISKKLFIVLLAFCFIISSEALCGIAYAEDNSAYESMSDSEKQAYLEKKINEANSRINELSSESKETQEYLDALDQKISYLNKQLNIIKNKANSAQGRINTLEQEYNLNQQTISQMNDEISNLAAQITALEAQFSQTYEQYAMRMRAIYISGSTSTLAFLIDSGDISQLLTRYEMVRRISKHDAELMSAIREQSQSIADTKSQLGEKSQALKEKQLQLTKTQNDLNSNIIALNSDKAQAQEKENALGQEQEKANKLLKALNDETKQYTEYRDTTQEELDQIDADIAAAAEKYKPKKTTAKSTTKKTTTEKNNSTTDKNNTNTTSTTTEQTQPPTPGGYINMTFPVPSQTRITTAFHGYSGHSGCDFSCPANSTVVAAESGTVIISRDLKNADGTYRSYGRYIVIAHDKTTASGQDVYTLYAHNNKRLVSEGTYVQKGQAIAKSGSTGNSTGPHCHFEVRTPSSSYNDCVNPANYLP